MACFECTRANLKSYLKNSRKDYVFGVAKRVQILESVENYGSLYTIKYEPCKKCQEVAIQFLEEEVRELRENKEKE
jgi:hypothetical protein